VLNVGVETISYTLLCYFIQHKAAESRAALNKLGKPTILVSHWWSCSAVV